MADTVKKEEFRDDKGFDEHREAGTTAGQEGADVHDADGVENDIAWASQRLLTFPERHLDGGTW